jgi:predicted metal-dependent hydrolase
LTQPRADRASLAPEQVLAHPDLRAGADGFNRHDFFEAHERWEVLWKLTDGELRELFRGLVLFATGLYKLQDAHRNLNGARMLLADAVTALDPLPRRLLGLKVGKLRRAARRCYRYALALLEEGSEESFPVELFPHVELPDQAPARPDTAGRTRASHED